MFCSRNSRSSVEKIALPLTGIELIGLKTVYHHLLHTEIILYIITSHYLPKGDLKKASVGLRETLYSKVSIIT